MRFLMSLILTFGLFACAGVPDRVYKLPDDNKMPAIWSPTETNNDLQLVQVWTLGFNSGNTEWTLIPKN